MSQFELQLSNLGLQAYTESLADQGFKDWDDVVNISENAMAIAGLSLGHRRKLQRAIATYQGYPRNEPLRSSSSDVYLHKRRSPESSHGGDNNWEIEKLTPPKRRYRRHPPKDPHAPQRPKSAYVLFANFLRQNKQVSDLPFIHISKLVGEKWRLLSVDEKALWKSRAAEGRSRYNTQVAEYQQAKGSQRHQEDCTCTNVVNKRRLNGGSCTQTSKDTQSRYKHLKLPFMSAVSSQDASKDISILVAANKDENHARNSVKQLKSFHIQALNPFHIVSGMTTRPFLDSFLQQVNRYYYCINPEYLVQQFNLTADGNVSLPNHIMYTVCICISIGCQTHDTGTDELAIMWYENGRRYLDSDDWGYNLDVMRALTLISIFHSCERPATARHYLDTAQRIGKARNLSIVPESTTMVDGTSSDEWILVWRTIQMMASILDMRLQRLNRYPDEITC